MAKIPFIALGLILLLSLLGSSTPAIASPGVAKWSGVNIPAEGKSGNWVLANGSDVQHLTMAIDDTLYCYATPTGASCSLFKSVDGGYSWSKTDYSEDTIAGIVCSGIYADIIYLTDGTHVYKSGNGGDSFSTLADASLCC